VLVLLEITSVLFVSHAIIMDSRHRELTSKTRVVYTKKTINY